jgi:predicted nucleic acid-binding protein
VILIDSSVWIDHLRGRDSPEAKRLASALAADEDLCTCGLILTEVLQGIQGDAAHQRVRRLLTALVYLPMPKRVYIRAADVYRTARAAGETVRNAVDCIIAACAIEHQVPLLQRDRDFLVLQRVSALKLARP